MVIHKYFTDLPFYHQGSIQQLLEVPQTASTVFDQVERGADAIYPVYQTLFGLTAKARHYYVNDTKHRIQDQASVEKKVRGRDKTQLRTGVYTSGVITTLADGRDIVLFETNSGTRDNLSTAYFITVVLIIQRSR